MFVDAQLRCKHFRHRVDSSCESEPESQPHIVGKRSIYEALQKFGWGDVYLEHPVDGIKPDVFWEVQGKYIAFEIQASSVDFKIYSQKIARYISNQIIVVYLFVPENFLKEVRPKIYSLKEIEKQMFCEPQEERSFETFGPMVIGAYLFNGIYIPKFQQKFAKGREGELCSHRFIINWKESIKSSYENFFEMLLDLNHNILFNL